MNNNKSDENALLAGCKGVFDKASYISIGTKEKPELYGAKMPKRDNFNGKQFGIVPHKDGRTVEVYFEKKHNWISDNDKYSDRVKYQGQEKKKGFLTGDFRKRDEFSNTVRTEQWREMLTQEDRFAKKALQILTGGDEAPIAVPKVETLEQQQGVSKPFLYDLVFEKPPTDGTGCSKLARDTLNPTRHTYDRHLRGQLTTSLMAHTPPTEFSKPEYARKPIIRDTFFRKVNPF